MREPLSLTPNRPEVLDEVFDGEAVLVNLRTGRYYALDAAATAIWRAVVDGDPLPEGDEVVPVLHRVPRSRASAGSCGGGRPRRHPRGEFFREALASPVDAGARSLSPAPRSTLQEFDGGPGQIASRPRPLRRARNALAARSASPQAGALAADRTG